MIVENVKFITSVADKRNFYKSEKPIIAVLGKSNVGKSSFINMLANINKLAKTSNTPGRTRLINYFDFDKFILADLPGYGYAKVSQAEKLKWNDLLNSYFEDKENIKHAFMLLDIRHLPTSDDMMMINYLYFNAIPYTIIATKCDKLSKNQIYNSVKALAKATKCGEGNIITTSSTAKIGRDKVLDKIEAILNLEN